jgi:unsaturated rhamnogalacturonyl hydrolase
MKKLVIISLILGIFLFVGCQKELYVEKVSAVVDRVISETIFDLIEVEQKKVNELNVLDFSNEYDVKEIAFYFAKSHVKSDSLQKVLFGSSSNNPFVIIVNGEEQFRQLEKRQLAFQEIAYNMYSFQDSFTLTLKKGNNEIIVRSLLSINPKIIFKEIVKPEMELEIKFDEWEFGKYESQKEGIEITKSIFSKINWKKQKNINQHKIEVPKVRTYNREAHNEWTYSNGATMLGMINIYNYNGNKKYFDFVKKYSDFTLEKYDDLKNEFFSKHSYRVANYRMFRKTMLDDAGAPTLPFILTYLETKEEKYLPIINEMAEYVINSQVRLEDGTFCRPEPVEMTVWADDMFMSVPMLLRIAQFYENKSIVDDAVKQIINIHKYLWISEKELHKHAWFNDRKEHSPVFWGRANGWIIWAITDALQLLPENSLNYKTIMKIYKDIIDGIIKYQDEDGMWHQVLDNPKSFKETSSTAMFTLAIASGVNNKWLPADYGKYALLGWEGISLNISNDGIVKDICRGTGIGFDEEFYDTRERFPNDPRGLGAVFTCAVEVEKLIRNF